MMLSEPGTATVITTENRGLTPEEYGQLAVKKIISIGPEAHPAIRAQAEAYAGQIEKIVTAYMHKAIRSDRTTIYNALMDAGHPELAKAIMEI